MPPGFRPLRPLGGDRSDQLWLCRDERLSRLVVLKPVSLEDGSSGGTALIADLRHPVLARVHGVLEGPNGHWLALEYIDGLPLSQADRIWSANCVAHVLKSLADALQVMGDAGVVHGDIAPGNVLLDSMGRVRLIDFGLAASLGESASGAGTPGFAAPEIVERAALHPSTDLWSVAAMGVWMLCGDVVGWVADAEGRLRLVLPRWNHADVMNRALCEVLSQVLIIDPCDRMPVSEFMAALTNLIRLHPADQSQLRAFAQAAS